MKKISGPGADVGSSIHRWVALSPDSITLP
jgi:hypothetical protein